MGSNLFFPDNVKRYDRMQQLLNDVTATKALAFQQIDSQKKITARVDTICKDLMKKSGFNTLEELHEAVMKTLPEKERNRYTRFIKELKDLDNLLGNVSVWIGIIGASTGVLGLAVDQKMRMIEMARDVDLRRVWNQGFHNFWHGHPIDGWREMAEARKAMRGHMAEAIEFAGEEAARGLRLWKILRNISEVMETIAKWCFIAELFVLWMQYTAEEEQRTQMRQAIVAFFYYRFATVELLKQIQATVDLYSNFEGYLVCKQTMIDSHLDETIMRTTLTTMATNIIAIHKPDLDDIKDDKLWAACHDFDARVEGMTVYKDDDPPEADVRDWLEKQAKKREAEEANLTEEQKAQKLIDAMNKAKENSEKIGVKT